MRTSTYPGRVCVQVRRRRRTGPWRAEGGDGARL